MQRERLIHVKVDPDAKRESVVETFSGVFEIAVREKARENAANDRVRALIARYYAVPAKSVSIRTGHRSPHKMIRVIY